MARTRPQYWRDYRAKRLAEDGFLDFEIRKRDRKTGKIEDRLCSIPFRIPYMGTMRKARRQLHRPFIERLNRIKRVRIARYERRMLVAGIEAEYADTIISIYRDNGWQREILVGPYKGQMEDDVWAMLREFRRRAIASGEYIPPKKSHHKQFFTEEELAALTEKRRKYRQEHRQEIRDYSRKYRGGQPALLRGWIRDLDKAIAGEIDPAKRERLEVQRERLRVRLGERA